MGLPALCLLFAGAQAAAEAGDAVLWEAALDRPPLYFAGAQVVLRVVQRSEAPPGSGSVARDFEWAVDWHGLLQGTAIMGRMFCPVAPAGRAQHSASEIVPCRGQSAEDLTAGSDIVRRIGAAAAGLGAKKIGMVGLGPGTMATYWQRFHPQVMRVDVVELSPVVVDVARRYFGMQTDERLRVHVSDGVAWLRDEGTPSFDVFVHDASGSLHAFLWPSVLQLIRKKTEGGTMLMNLMGVPYWLRFLGLAYLRTQFHEVKIQDDVLIASWKPIIMNWHGLPQHVKEWYHAPGWQTYQSLSVGELALYAGFFGTITVIACLLLGYYLLTIALRKHESRREVSSKLTRPDADSFISLFCWHEEAQSETDPLLGSNHINRSRQPRGYWPRI
jgi:hypothetical protein